MLGEGEGADRPEGRVVERGRIGPQGRGDHGVDDLEALPGQRRCGLGPSERRARGQDRDPRAARGGHGRRGLAGGDPQGDGLAGRGRRHGRQLDLDPRAAARARAPSLTGAAATTRGVQDPVQGATSTGAAREAWARASDGVVVAGSGGGGTSSEVQAKARRSSSTPSGYRGRLGGGRRGVGRLAAMALLRWSLVLLCAAVVAAQALVGPGPPLRVVAPTTPVRASPPPGSAVAARLTADDVARGVVALARQPADAAVALDGDQRRALAPLVARGVAAHQEHQVLRSTVRQARLDAALSLAEAQP